MKLVVDTHTHTVSSGHAYSTVQEIAREAGENGIKMFAITDHGPAMKGAPYLYHFGNLRVIPETLYGIRVVKGVEANIVDYDGTVDMPEEYLRKLEFVMASFHDICIEPSSVEENTTTMINALKNPFVDAVAHPGNPRFQVDIDRVVMAARDLNKLIEINNQSFLVRKGCEKNCLEFIGKCKKYGVRITCGSDAHISFDVGKFDKVYDLIEKVQMPEELILGTSVEKFEDYLKGRRQQLKQLGLLR